VSSECEVPDALAAGVSTPVGRPRQRARPVRPRRFTGTRSAGVTLGRLTGSNAGTNSGTVGPGTFPAPRSPTLVVDVAAPYSLIGRKTKGDVIVTRPLKDPAGSMWSSAWPTIR